MDLGNNICQPSYLAIARDRLVCAKQIGVGMSWQIGIKLMEAARSSRSSSTEQDEIDYDTKVLRDVDPVDTTTSADLQSSAKGESSVQHQAASCPEENPESKSEAAGSADDDMATKLRRKIYEAGLGDVRVPDLHSMSGCSDCEETESDDDDDDDLCSDSSDDNEESSYNPLASGVMPPVLPVSLSFNSLFS